MNSRSPQFLASGGVSEATCGKVAPWSNEVATTGYHCAPLAIIKAAYTVPSGPTVTAGSHALTLDPLAPGSDIGAPKFRPPSVERANPMPEQPIQSSYTYPTLESAADSTSAF